MSERIRAARAAVNEYRQAVQALLLDCRNAGPDQAELEDDVHALIRDAEEAGRGIEVVTKKLHQRVTRRLQRKQTGADQ